MKLIASRGRQGKRLDSGSRNLVQSVWRKPCVLVASGVLALGLAACGSPAADKEDTVTIWQAFNPEEGAVFREFMAEFEEQYEQETGRAVSVDIQYVSFGDMFTKLRTAALADITPDIAFVDAIKVTDLAFGQAVLPVNSLEGFQARYGSIEEARDEFVHAAFDAGVVNRLGQENLYGLPVQTTTVALYWNREMFRQKANALRDAGLDPSRAPVDWDEFISYGQVLTDPGRNIYGYGMHGSLWFNFPFFNMYEVDFINYDDKGLAQPVLDTPNGRAALDRLLGLAKSGIEGGAWRPSALSPDAGFLNRRYAMILTGPWNVENFTNAGLDFDISLIPAPTEDEIDRLGLQPASPELEEELGQRAYTSSNVGGQTGVILRRAREPELAYEVLEYFTSENVQRRWASELGQIPTRRAAWEDLDVSKYPYITKFMTQLLTARRIPQIPLYGMLESDVFNPQIDLLLNERQTPEQMLERMEASMEDRILRRINEGVETRMASGE